MFTEQEVKKQIDQVKQSIEKKFKELFPVKGDKRTLKLDNVEFGKVKDLMSLKKHTEIKLKERSLTIPIRATFTLIDNDTGKTVDNKRVNIIRMPIMTPRGSFLIDGNEYQATNQMRLKAGVYTKVANNGELQSQVNIANKRPFKIKLDSETEIFTIKAGSSNIGMYAFLKGMGVTDTHIKKYIGADLLDSNMRDNGNKTKRALQYFAKHMTYTETENVKEARKAIKEFFQDSQMNPETTSVTLGKKFEKVNTDLILETARKLLKVTKGEEEEDDRDSLAFKKILNIEDYLAEVIEEQFGKLEKSFLNNVDRHEEIKKIVSPQDFHKPIKNFFTTSDLVTAVEIINPLSALGNKNKITIMGEGGVKSNQQITDDMININPSTIGFIDPVHTPESGKIGANLHISALAEKEGNTLVTRVIDAKTGKIVKITPDKVERSVIAFPDQYDRKKKKFKNKTVKVMNKKEIDEVSKSKVDYILLSPKGMFDLTTNMIPFLQNTQGNRAMMGGKMQEQAISLKSREAPLVQTGVSGNKSFEQVIGQNNALKSPVSGTVTSTDPLKIKDSKGKVHEISTYDHYPLGGSSMNHHELKVSKGDKVKKGQILADTNFTKDGQMALGTNMTVAFMPYKGFTFEDGLVLSESGSEKTTSVHLYTEELEVDSDTTVDKKKYKTYYPTNLSASNASKLDEQGVIKKGAKVEEGDILVAAFKKKQVTEVDVLLKRIKNKLALDKRDAAIRWDKDVIGEVKDVIKTRSLIKITIKTEEKAKVGDKIVGRYGNKGTVTKIIPDEEMPRTKDGTPIEIILNPHTVPSRMNPSQLLETAAAKIAEKTGKPYIVNNFDGKNHLKEIKKKMKELGISEKEVVVDPEHGELENPIFVGKQYMLKLHHQTKKKFSARSFNEGYDMDDQPLRGGNNSGQALDVLTNYALLAHGAKENLREMATIKSNKNDEFWRAFQSGRPLPKPKQNVVFDKFIANMQGLGVKVHKTRNSYQLMAMTDRDIDELSNGAIKDAKVIRAKDLKEYDGGLFDPKVTGGKEGGEHWSHIDLEQPIPNPVFEKPIKVLLDLKAKEYKAILNGEKEINGKYGGEAIKEMLSRIDVDSELEKLNKEVKDAPVSKKDKMHKKIRYLSALKKTNRKPTDYVLSKIPVMPPKFRPIYETGRGNVGVSDVNEFYRHIILVNDAIKRDKETGILDEKEMGTLTSNLYQAVGSMQGISDPITWDAQNRGRKGILREIGGTGGTQPKDAFFQKKVVKRRQDLSGRATIVAGPELDVDEAGLPKEMAWKIYKPHIMKKLIKAGIPPHKARNEHYEKRSKMAQKVLEQVAEETPIMLNRAPSLHKFSVMAFKPKLVDGKSIRLPSLVVTGFNADFDGDSMAVHVPVTESAKKEALDKMLPSKNLFKPGHGDFMTMLSMEQIMGIYLMTKNPDKKKKSKGKYNSTQEAMRAYEKARRSGKKWSKEDPVEVKGFQKPLTIGKIEVNKILPDRWKRWDKPIDKRYIKQMLSDVGKTAKNKKEATTLANKLKDLGNDHVYKRGFTLGISDLDINYDKKNQIYGKAAKKVKGKKGSELFKEFSEAEEEVYKNIIKENPDNSFVMMHTSGAKGGPDNLRSILAGPGLLTDNKGQVVPTPVTTSYSEGIDTSSYWTAMYGARKGMIDRAKSTSEPGAFTKQLINNVLDLLVTEKDCGTTKGRERPISNPNIKNRLLAKDVTIDGATVAKKGDILNSKLIKDLKKKDVEQVTVRSPLRCEASEGVCSKCYGAFTDGNLPAVGENVGVLAGHAMTEPSTQMTMNSFHSGGVASNEVEKAQGLERLNQILEMPKTLKNKATIAKANGKVTKIETTATGGKNVYVGKKKHFVPSKLKLKVKKGDILKKGDRISSGVIKPQELLETQGLDAVRNYMTDELYETYGGNVNEATLETVVQKVTNLTKVEDAGDSEFTPGQYAPLNKIEAFNKGGTTKKPLTQAVGKVLAQTTGGIKQGTKLTNKDVNKLRRKGVTQVTIKADKVKHAPELKGINQLPLTNPDWIAKMNFNNIPGQMLESAATGAESKFKDTNNPIPAYVHGTEFGKTPNKY